MDRVQTDTTNTCSSAIQFLFTSYLALLPFQIGPTARYLLSGMLIIAAMKHILEQGRHVSTTQFLRSPVVIFLIALNILAIISISSSPEPRYSMAVFFEDLFLNSILFSSMAIFVANSPQSIEWEKSIRIANILFLLAYLGLMIQWIMFPNHPLCIRPEAIARIHSRWDAIFAFGNGCSLFHGIKHTSMFLTLMLAYWAVWATRGMLSITGMAIFLLDLFTLLTTTRRAACLAVFSGICLAPLLFKSSARYLKVAIAFLAVLVLVFVVSGNSEHFIRENWQLLMKGEVQKAKDLGGSIPLRISTYKVFTKQILKEPFKPHGLGRKLIKEYQAELVKKAGLLHGHNTFLNFAFYMGVQGSLALLGLILSQAWLFWTAWKKTPHGNEAPLMAVGLIFIFMFWGTNMFTDGFRHGSATMYWLFTAIPTGIALKINRSRP